MTPEYWDRIEALFEAASELPADDRSAYLDSLQVEEGARRDVEGMLRALGTGPLAIRDAIASGSWLAQQEFDAAPDPPETRRFGPYRVTGTLGHGGMGSVYLAVRDDSVFTSDVAIKVLRHEFGEGDGVRERFRQERQILAALNHPHIARLLDGGEQPAPYLVMEKIEGVAITQFCESLPLPARLRLFLGVCEAVHYAHAHLVVHRDLKPANILVTPEGTPKLLDFGIAKLLPGAESRTANPGLTQGGLRMLTPDYASPEQFRGETITTASDVYSLGAILYEMLAGVPPHRREHVPPHQLHSALEREPLLPSLAAPAHLRTPLAGDLDNIVMLALRREPEQRYRSVEALASDVRRHLDGRPVLARPATIRYRTAKFLKRHWWEAGALCLVVASLTIGFAAAVYEARLAAQRYRDVRQLANRFLFEFDDSVRDLPGATKSRELVVRTGLEYLDRLASQAGGNTDLMSEIAAGYSKIGDVQGSPSMPSLGRTTDALASYARSRTLWERVLAAHPGDSKALRGLAQVRLTSGDLFRVSGKTAEAAQLFTQAAEAAASALVAAPNDPDTLFAAAGAWLRTGDIRSGLNQQANARDAFQQALELYRRVAQLRPQERYLNAVAITLSRLGLVASSMEQIADSRAYHEESLALRQELLKRSPNAVTYRRGMASELLLMGAIYSSSQSLNLEDPETAVSFFRRGAEIQRALTNADANDRTSRIDLMLGNMRLCETLALIRPAEALAYCTESVKAGEVLFAAGARADVNQYTVLAELGHAMALLKLRRGAAVRAAAESALRRMRAPTIAFIGFRYNRMRAYTMIGDSYQQAGDLAHAREAWLQARASPPNVPMQEADMVQVRQLAWLAERLSKAPGENRCARLQEAATIWAEWRRRGGRTLEMASSEGCN